MRETQFANMSKKKMQFADLNENWVVVWVKIEFVDVR
jgi:hypothetical protein